VKSPFLYYLALPALVVALPAQADLNYSSEPLYLNKGVQPNVALLLDTSGSMDNVDTGSFGPVAGTCSSTVIKSTGGELSRREAVKLAACSMVQDNANSMRIAAFGYATTNVNSVRDWGDTVSNLKTGINLMGSSTTGTPIVRSLYGISRAYRGQLTYSTPIQYRCQKNYAVFFTDGEPNDSQDSAASPTFATAADTMEDSPWSGSSGLYNWDNYTDPVVTSSFSSNTFRPWLDDVAQFMYDMDFMKAGSAPTRACPVGSALANTTNSLDCAGKSWDDPDYPAQNIITHMMGYGAEVNTEMMRDASLVNRILIDGTMVDTAADTLTIANHNLESGDYVHYYPMYQNNDYNTTATANTGTETLTGNTLNMATGDALGYDNDGGATLQYQVITTPPVPAAICGAIGGLVSGTSYYVDGDTVDRFRLSTTSSNAYASTALSLTGTGTANTIHSFTRTHASAGFLSTNAGTTPVDTTANIEKITRTAHGLNTGDFVTYTCTGTSCAIGGLTSGSNYYVARRSADEFRLATTALLAVSCADAIDGSATVGTSCRNLSSRGSAGGVQMFQKIATETIVTFSATGSGTVPVNTGTETLTAVAHGFNVGDRVTYTCSNFAGTPAVYTSYNLPTTVYARDVVPGNPGTFKVALSSGGAALDISDAGTAAQSFFWTKPVAQSVIPGLQAYVTDLPPDATPNPITEDAAKGKYYVEKIDEDTIKLYECFQYCQSPFEPVKVSFAGTDVQIAGTSEYIDVIAHGFTTGTQVTYYCPGGCSGGLTNNSTYYVGVVNANRIRLATSAAAATACATGTMGCVDLTSTVAVTQFLTATEAPARDLVDLTATTGLGMLSTGPGNFYPAQTAEELSVAMQEVFNDIRMDSSGRTSEWITSASLLKNTQAYNTRFNGSDWSGDVQANPRRSETGMQTDPPIWKASEQLPADSARNIVTRSDTYGARAFTTANWSSLTATQQTALSNGVSSTVGQNVLNWIRGQEVSGYRTRTNGVLGDFLGSAPSYIAAPNRNYENTLPVGAEQSSYAAFKAGQANRTPMIYAGANDGMLHAFDASSGVESFAFIPEAVYMDWLDLDNDGIKDAGEAAINKFYELARPFYGIATGQSHQYFVDGSPTVGDAYFGGSWHTVLMGGLGKGGRSVYALDVTDPSAFGVSKVLWEFDDSNSGEMGYSYSQPQIARLQNGTWVAIFGNGYDSAGDMARLFIVNLQTGALIRQIDAGPAGNNGLSSVTVRNDATDTAIAVYAGDLQGNIWKFDISNTTPTNWTATTIFTAMDSSGNRQAITSGITLGENPLGGVMLYVGTGAYFRVEDRSYNGTPVYDAMYGLWDNDTGSISANDLIEQIVGTTVIMTVNGANRTLRTATAYPIDYSGGNPDRGWSIKLLEAAYYQGEKIIERAIINDDLLQIYTILPVSGEDPCSEGVSAMTMMVDSLSGAQLSEPVFDTNLDGVIDGSDVSAMGYVMSDTYDDDGIPSDMDNCPNITNPDQLNADNDSRGDMCDDLPQNTAATIDSDNDGVPDAWDISCDVVCQQNSGLVIDNCPVMANSDQIDTDGDSYGNRCDDDNDNDDILDVFDSFPEDANQWLGNTNILATIDGGSVVSGAGDVNGDSYPDLIIANPIDSTNGSQSGSVRIVSGIDRKILYVFYGDNSGDQFGYSIDSAGDVNNDGYADIIVGARYDDDSGTNSGSARVFSGIDGSILYTLYGRVAHADFGYSVSGAGDANNDGYDDVIVGAPDDDTNGNWSGTAQLFNGRTGAVLYTWNGSGYVSLGESVNAAGDVNNDGYDDVIVGSYPDIYSIGFAQVYSGANGSIIHAFYGEVLGKSFGESVSAAGDVNNDGYDDVIVGSKYEDHNGYISGSAYLYSGFSGDALYIFNGDSPEDLFGRYVSSAGDVNNDGYADVIVSATHDDNNELQSGSARVLSGVNGSTIYVLNGDGVNAYFGQTPSGVGDINKDGYDDFAVGPSPIRLFSGKGFWSDNDLDGQNDAIDDDDDDDQVPDMNDAYPINIAASLDSDNDGFPNSWNAGCNVACQVGSSLVLDNCPNTSNLDQLDTDDDTQGDVCDSDDDNDDLTDSEELALGTNPLLQDTDIDGINDNADNCPANSNSNQLNTDGDTRGNACDMDDDNDGVGDPSDRFPLNAAASSDTDNDGYPGSWNVACDLICQAASGLILDNCPSNANADQLNTDGDTQGNVCDTDDDNDGVIDASDAYPLDASESVDTDGDSIGNNADWDDDNDGVPDTVDFAPLDAGDASELILPLEGIYKGTVIQQGIQN